MSEAPDSRPAETGTPPPPPAPARPDEPPPGSGANNWLTTYSDMMTLLMTFFILLFTFATRHTHVRKRPPRGPSLLAPRGGEGLATRQDQAALESVVWRELPVLPRPQAEGSETPPAHSDPSPGTAAEVLRLLERAPAGTMADSYSMRVPLSLLFGPGDHLSASGELLLRAVAANLRPLPYDVQLLVDDPRNTPRALALARRLTQHEGLHPGRLGVGLRPAPGPWTPSVWLVYVRRP